MARSKSRSHTHTKGGNYGEHDVRRWDSWGYPGVCLLQAPLVPKPPSMHQYLVPEDTTLGPSLALHFCSITSSWRCLPCFSLPLCLSNWCVLSLLYFIRHKFVFETERFCKSMNIWSHLTPSKIFYLIRVRTSFWSPGYVLMVKKYLSKWFGEDGLVERIIFGVKG